MFKEKDKGFKYQGSNDAGSRKDNQKGRIIVNVNAGDKKIAASKAKQKKRKIVGSTDKSTLSMNTVEWTDDSYDVIQFAKLYQHKLPLIVKVVQGYQGEIMPTLAIDQTYMINKTSVQKRVFSLDSENRHISIPTDYPLTLTAADNHGNRGSHKLDEILNTRELPLRIEVDRVLGDVQGSTDIIGKTLKLQEIKDGVFLTGNSIDDGWINQSEIITFPHFLGIEFSVAIGMRGALDDEWIDYQGMFSRSVRHLQFEQVKGYKGVVVHDDLSVVSAPVITPKNTVDRKDKNSNSEDTTYENFPKPRRPQDFRASGSDRMSFTTQSPLYDNSNDLPPQSPDDGYSTIPGASKNYENIPMTNLTKTKAEVHRTSGEDMRYPSNRPMYGNMGYSTTESSRTQASQCETGYESCDDEIDVHDMFSKVIEVAEEEEERRRTLELKREKHESNIPHYQTAPNRASVVVVESKSNLYSHLDPNPPEALYAVPDRSSKRISAAYENSAFKATPFESIEDVPQVLDSLSVEEVCKCLEMLNMETHINDFRKHLIDGESLTGLKQADLQQEFNFTPFNAHKLLRFTRGWRPKLS